MPPRLPKFHRPPLPPNPLQDLRQIVKDGRAQVDKALDGIRSLARELRSSSTAETPTQTPESKPGKEKETKAEEECPTCSSLSDLKEFIERRRVERALSDLEKGEGSEDKRRSLQTVRKYIEGEDIG